VLIGIAAALAVGIAKPWGVPKSYDAPASPTARANATHGPSTGPSLAPTPDETFAVATPPPQGSPWTTLRWRQLPAGDPLAEVRSTLRWSGGYVAVGARSKSGAPSTPLWTSLDGGTWSQLASGGASSFWAGTRVDGMTSVGRALVGLLEPGAECGGFGLCAEYGPPAMVWTSLDGRTWRPTSAPDLGPASSWEGALLASNSDGLVAIALGTPTSEALSTDGSHWRTAQAGTIPSDFAPQALVGRPTGFVLAGTFGGADRKPAALWSTSGTAWTTVPLPGPPGANQFRPSSVSLVAASDGFILSGQPDHASSPYWWQSSNGQEWRLIPTEGPIGLSPAPTGREQVANGLLVGDGQRMLAVRVGSEPGIWESFDGLNWRRVAGSMPSDNIEDLVLLPGGAVVSDGTAAWYGTATIN
jgi:hypothetical protein